MPVAPRTEMEGLSPGNQNKILNRSARRASWEIIRLGATRVASTRNQSRMQKGRDAEMQECSRERGPWNIRSIMEDVLFSGVPGTPYRYVYIRTAAGRIERARCTWCIDSMFRT